MILTFRDISILKMCLEQKFMTLDQIAKMFFQESKHIYRVPARRVNLLMKHGYLRAFKPNFDSKTLYLIAMKGVRLLAKKNLSNGLRIVKNRF